MPTKFTVYEMLVLTGLRYVIDSERHTAGITSICHRLFSPSESHEYNRVVTRPTAWAAVGNKLI